MIDDTETELHAAARALQRHSWLIPADHPEDFALVRRHSAELKSRFSHHLGYRLVVEPSFARLLKSPLPPGSPTRPLLTPSGKPVTARVCQYVALVCASLLAPNMSDQMLISTLVTQVRADAATAGIVITDTTSERRDLVTAISVLLRWGVLEETDGAAAEWVTDQEQEALLTVHREELPHLIANPVGVSMRNDHPVRNIVRRLVENPVMLRTELDDDERRALGRDRGVIENSIEELFGLAVEVRREGVLVWGDEDDVTDEPFPGIGAARQASLLFIAEVVESWQPSEDGWIHITRPEAVELVERLLRRNEGMWRTDFDPETPDAGPRVLTIITNTLTGLGLAITNESGLQLSPAAARYRPTVQRHAAATPDNPLEENISLFDDIEDE